MTKKKSKPVAKRKAPRKDQSQITLTLFGACDIDTTSAQRLIDVQSVGRYRKRLHDFKLYHYQKLTAPGPA